MIPAAVPIALATSSIVSNLITLYGVASDLNDWMNKHLEAMQQSENSAVSQTGKVLMGAKFGFGIGYAAPVIAIATGQMLLGNTFAAIPTVATAATLSNPIAMTCASIGAIYYGWKALSETERNEILEKLSTGLSVGKELILSVVRYLIENMSPKKGKTRFPEIFGCIENEARLFGRKASAIAGETAIRITDLTAKGAEKAIDTANNVTESLSDLANNPMRIFGRGNTDKAAIPIETTPSKEREQ